MKLSLLNILGVMSLAAPAAVEARGSEPIRMAKYRVTFRADWNPNSHPVNFPRNPHFSGLVGATHRDGVEIWQDGGLASGGIEQMAETGAKGALISEVNELIADGLAESVLSGGGIRRSPGVTSMVIEVSSQYPAVSLVSMLAPSPDWFVGVNSLNLRNGNRWVNRRVVDLVLYDAGTDNGARFTSADSDTVPQERIEKLSSRSQDTDFNNGRPFVGQFIFERIRD